MPAVQLARLKIEIASLLEKATRPAEFLRGVYDLFDFYADRVYRPGQTVQPASRFPLFHVPPLIVQQLQLGLRPFCRANQAAALELFDALWRADYLEPRLLGAFILGQVSPEPPQPVVQRLETAVQGKEDIGLLESLLTDSSTRLRLEATRFWLHTLETWLDSPSLELKKAGLLALLPLVRDRSFENLPPVYNLTSSPLQDALPALQPALQDVLTALVQRSPRETLYYLKQILASSTQLNTARLIRRLLPLFSAEDQASLRQALVSRPGIRPA
jgi:hypothetical protein